MLKKLFSSENLYDIISDEFIAEKVMEELT
jgi:hypothetical protein